MEWLRVKYWEPQRELLQKTLVSESNGGTGGGAGVVSREPSERRKRRKDVLMWTKGALKSKGQIVQVLAEADTR